MISSGPVLRPASPSTARRLSVPRCYLESPDYSRRCRWSMKPRVLPPLHGAAPRRCRLAVLGTIGHAAANSQDLFSPASCSAIFCRDLEGPSRCTTTSRRLSVYSVLRNSQRRISFEDRDQNLRCASWPVIFSLCQKDPVVKVVQNGKPMKEISLAHEDYETPVGSAFKLGLHASFFAEGLTLR